MSRMGTRWLLWPIVTLVLGLAITATLALVSHAQYANNEKRLLRLRVRDASALITEALPAVQTPLASAAELADATDGNVQKFTRFVSPYVGTAPGHPFVSISLWRPAGGQGRPLAVEGISPELAGSAPLIHGFLVKAAQMRSLSVVGLQQASDPRLGYALSAPNTSGRFVVYGEARLPPDRRSRLQQSSQFADLDYALYIGPSQRPQDLLVTDLNHPLQGTTYAVNIPFGNTILRLVMSPRAPLSGSLPHNLPWIIAVVGTLLSIGAAYGVMRLAQRRRGAERLAERLESSASENRRLYAEQRSIAQTLQHALLPDRLPQIDGIQSSARYEAGERGVDIGGDWYDVIELGQRRLLLVVGDVSGRGLRAATTMAALRYAIHAYAAQNDEPTQILNKLSRLITVSDGGQIATILCAVVDIERREISVSSAGHLPPLLISDGASRFVQSDIGLPIGAETGTAYTATTISAPHNATFVAFTDGLVEQRGESIDQGLQRLRDAATGNDGELTELLSKLVRELPRAPVEDDIAIVGLRWTS